MGERTQKIDVHHKVSLNIYAFGIGFGFTRAWEQLPCFLFKVQFLRHTWRLRVGLKGLP